MDDSISRQAVIEAFEKELSAKYNGREFAIGIVGVKRILDNLPSVQTELCYGYSIKELALFAAVCRKYGIEESDMKKFANNCERALEIVRKEQDEIIRRSIAYMRGEEHENKGD